MGMHHFNNKYNNVGEKISNMIKCKFIAKLQGELRCVLVSPGIITRFLDLSSSNAQKNKLVATTKHTCFWI